MGKRILLLRTIPSVLNTSTEFIPVFDVQEELLVRYGIDLNHALDKVNMKVKCFPFFSGCYWTALASGCSSRYCM